MGTEFERSKSSKPLPVAAFFQERSRLHIWLGRKPFRVSLAPLWDRWSEDGDRQVLPDQPVWYNRGIFMSVLNLESFEDLHAGARDRSPQLSTIGPNLLYDRFVDEEIVRQG